MTTQDLAESVPHVYRKRILLEWLPVATPDMANPAMQNLFNAYFIFIEPNGVKKENCPKCVSNVLENWNAMQDALVAAEKEYETLEQLKYI